ncbi:YggS family pyridoxal phosphate-dependent enzyme [Agriterribacter sp.]|uniref:YggS family pyridoxal phosphate-dependent enzyme n=1 Tax=Agriterribacter sp. TaxID=2821509 RepID=UPI002B73BE14|nr:YggS family pyridoxal phosphate-dependent enzyme [Agriterribacter sp.]HTN09058.1 YggS family pyridoxal phosphate-dependent enzyme [Agriterribacter sp.]
MNHIRENLAVVHQRILNACRNSNRNPHEVSLLLATKTVSAENIKIALQLGETIIGENKVQELKEKFDALKDIPHQTHYIGHLQTNKIKEVIKYANCIQSVDRIELVQKLDQRLQREGRSIDMMLQVNTSYEESKFGLNPEAVINFAKEVCRYDTLKVKGLMTIGLFSAEKEKVRKCFQLLKDIRTELIALALPNFEMQQLSMGMSNDLETAIEEGSTMIRVGTAIFGSRIYPDSYYWNEKTTIQ